MSAVRVLASPHRIKASHRRRWKGAAGRFVQRYYDPIIGRFLSVDPVAADPSSGGNFNRYNYANGNPYKFTDPDGRQTWNPDGTVSWDPPAKTGPFGEPLGGTNPIVTTARELTTAGAQVEEGVVTVFSGSAEARVAGEIGEAGAGGARAGKPFTRAGKAEVRVDNAAEHGGQTTCMRCGRSTVPAQQSRAGVTPPKNETHVDHIVPKSKGGNGSPDNGQILCRECNLRKADEHTAGPGGSSAGGLSIWE